MLEAMKNLHKRNIEYIDSNKIFPLMRWTSGDISNLNLCKDVNRSFFFVDRNILLGYLAFNLKPKQFIKYPKAKKFDNKKLDLILSYLQKHYKYGKNDLEQLKQVVINKLNNKEELEVMANNFGLDNKERKLLGVNQVKFDKKKMEEKKQKSLF